MTDLGTLGGTNSYAIAINDRGQVVGYSGTDRGMTGHAFLYSDGAMTDLGTLGGAVGSWASAINDRGQVVGYVVHRRGRRCTPSSTATAR